MWTDANALIEPGVRALHMRAKLNQVGVLVGGIIPEEDIPKLTHMGVARVFGPGTSMAEIVSFLRGRAQQSGAVHA